MGTYIRNEKRVIFNLLRCSSPIMSLMPSSGQFPDAQGRVSALRDTPGVCVVELNDAQYEEMELEIAEEDLKTAMDDGLHDVLKRAIEDAEKETSSHSHA